MKSPGKKYLPLIFLTFIIFSLSFPAVYFLWEKADLPFKTASSGDKIFIKSIAGDIPGLSIQDEIVSVAGIDIQTREELEVFLDSKRVGEKVRVIVRSPSGEKEIEVAAVHFYSLSFIILQSLVSLGFILFGLIVLFKGRDYKPASLFHLAMTGAAVIMIMTWGRYSGGIGPEYVTRTVFHFAYLLTPIFFVHFALVFPVDRSESFRRFIQFMYIAGIGTAFYITISFTGLIFRIDKGSISRYIDSFNTGRYFLSACVIISIAIFLLGYTKTSDIVQRKKLKWLIAGFLTGPLSFILLWVIPQAFTDYGIIPEEWLSVLMLAVPSHLLSALLNTTCLTLIL